VQSEVREPATRFALTRSERRRWGIVHRDGVLSLRATGWEQTGAAAQLAVAGVIGIGAVRFGSPARVWPILLCGLAVAALALVGWAGLVSVSPRGLTVWWLPYRRIAWDEVVGFEVVVSSPWWAPSWPPFEVVEATLQDGRRVTLWPTRSCRPGAIARPSAANVAGRLLERYRAALDAEA